MTGPVGRRQRQRRSTDAFGVSLVLQTFNRMMHNLDPAQRAKVIEHICHRWLVDEYSTDRDRCGV